jgi:hypothetical protein
LSFQAGADRYTDARTHENAVRHVARSPLHLHACMCVRRPLRQAGGNHKRLPQGIYVYIRILAPAMTRPRPSSIMLMDRRLATKGNANPQRGCVELIFGICAPVQSTSDRHRFIFRFSIHAHTINHIEHLAAQLTN